MKQSQIIKALFCVFIGSAAFGQQPVKYELVKLAETVVLPPLTPEEAYSKTQVNGVVDEKKLFGSFYERMEKIGKEIYVLTEKQADVAKHDKKASEKAIADGFADMSTSEQAKYLKNNPALQSATGVSSSMLELAAKMEDPEFKKKFDAMSDAEKAKLVMSYQQPQNHLTQKLHTQTGLKTVIEAGKIIDQFNKEYRGHRFSTDLAAQVKALEKAEEEKLKPVLEEKQKLMGKIGKGSSEAVSVKLKEVIAKEWDIRNETQEKKLKLCRNYAMNTIASYKLAAKPFDDYIAEINHGEDLKARNEAKELAQLAGYQEGLLREIYSIQEIVKDMTLNAASFYARMKESKREK